MTSSGPRSGKGRPSSKPKFRLMFLPKALAEYRELDGSVQAHLKRLLAKRLEQPHVPGGQLHGDLSNCYKIKLLKQGIRLVYVVEDEKLIVLVVAVDKREDSAAYRSAVERIVGAASALADAPRPSASRRTIKR